MKYTKESRAAVQAAQRVAMGAKVPAPPKGVSPGRWRAMIAHILHNA